jgi:hypothetical protein
MTKSDWDLIDRYQQHFGEQAAFERAQSFMFAYLSQIKTPLPPLAAMGLEVAREFRNGKATEEDRAKALADIWNHIREKKAVSDTSPKYLITRAVTWLLRERLAPGESEHISEVVNWFLYFVNQFEDHSNSAPILAQRFFSCGETEWKH